MHWEKSPQSAMARSRPYQGVRVRDPVKELLRRKRSQEQNCTIATSNAADVVTQNNQSSYPQAVFGSDAAAPTDRPVDSVSEGEVPCSDWKAPLSTTGSGLQPATMPWPSSDYNQQDPSAQTLAYPAAPGLGTDVYMQTLCPSYTMLTYTHTPLLTNFGTIPVAQAPCSLPQMELPDSGLTYFPWAQPLTTISTMPNSGVQFTTSGSSTLSGSPLVQMPLSMSLTTMIPQLDSTGAGPQTLIPDHSHYPEHQMNPDVQDLDDDEVERESPSLLDKLLEERKEDCGADGKDSYGSIFIPNV